jgi:flagellar biogenesis protein FliO
MEFYQLNFAALVAVNTGCTYRQYRQDKQKRKRVSIVSEIEKSAGKEEITRFTNDFFAIYLLVVAADWLQVSISNSFGDGGTNTKMTGSSHLCSVQI